jgi:Fe-S cluster assembly ATPase SufC
MIPRRGGRSDATGYKMVDSVTVRNFRSFKDVKVDDCRRINVIVGDNGSGKTALLEAIFLAAGVTPELILRTRRWRGDSAQGQVQGTPEDIHDALWSDLFYKFQTSKPALVKLEGRGDENRSVTVTLHKKGQVRVIAPDRKRPHDRPRVVPAGPAKPISFRWSIKSYGDFSIDPTLEDGKLIFSDAPAEPMRASFLAANQTAPSTEMANRFSALSQSFDEQDFIDSFSQIFPTISHLSLEMSVGMPMIYAKVDGLPRKLPLNLASGGMNKLVSILLTITAQSGGIVLIDEIENGFYYKHMPTIWQSLLAFARRYDCQLFVSTHSSECLDALARVAEESPEEFCMLRAVHSGDGTTIRRFDGERFAHAVLDSVEVR